MSDVQLVTVDLDEGSGVGFIEPDPNGTHLLVPVEAVAFLVEIGDGYLIELPEDMVCECPTCGGSGEESDWHPATRTVQFLKCPNCHGRGWRLHTPQVDCPTCGGGGEVWDEEQHGFEVNRRPCPDCNGVCDE